MAWNTGLSTLQNELADLYPTSMDARRLATEATLSIAHLDLEDSPINIWYELLTQADQRSKVDALVEIVCGEYPTRCGTLIAALNTYRQDQIESDQDKPRIPSTSSALGELINTYLPQIVIGVITGLITTWILGVMTNWVLLSKLKVVFEAVSIFLTPLLIREGFARANIAIGQVALIVLSALLIIGEAALFSMFPGRQMSELPTGYPQETGIFANTYLRGYTDCRDKEPKCLNRLRVARDANVRVETASSAEMDTLHILLDIEWDKWEKFPTFPRNYRGKIYYTIVYDCDAAVVERPTLAGYSLMPGSILLSWLIGFVEIPFVLENDSTIVKHIHEISVERDLICPT